MIAGGHAAFNPEPIADFIDAAVLGDGEQAVGAITDIVRDWQAPRASRRSRRAAAAARRHRRGLRPALLRRQLPARRPNRGRRTEPRPACRRGSRKHTVMNLDEWPYPKTPLVPLAETVHERMSVEIFRGCTRGCRFCQAGMITRPVRERSHRLASGRWSTTGWRATGFEEVGLLSLSSADHSEIGELAKQLADRYEDERVSLSLPSTRVDAFNIDLANEFSPQRPAIRADLRPGGRLASGCAG